MFSHWLTDHQDELLKFVSGHHHHHHNQQQNHDQLLIVPPPPPSAAVLPSSLLDNCSSNNNNNNNNNITYTNNVGQINTCNKPRQGSRRKAIYDHTHVETPADYLKKIIHRDVERQRRQEMAALYQSLRSKIPPEFLQGKRSISDHIHGTIRYIRYMQRRTDELKNKRDGLKEYLNPTTSKRFDDQTNIEVKPSTTGMEIKVSTVLKPATGAGCLPISRVLNVLVLEGMSVKSCISAPVHQKMLHIIEIDQVNEERRMDPSQLESKLMSLINLN